MEKNFINIAEKIEARQLAITEALEAEAEAISEAEPMLLEHYKKSVRSVLDGLVNNTEEQGQELLKDLTRSNKDLELFLKILLPTTLLIGVTIGILGTLYLHEPQVLIDPTKIVKGRRGIQFYRISELRTKIIEAEEK